MKRFAAWLRPEPPDRASSACRAWLPAQTSVSCAIFVDQLCAYVGVEGDFDGPRLGCGGTDRMAHGRLHHDIQVAERATAALVAGLVLVGFVVLAAAAAIYDIGKLLMVW